MNKYMKKLKLFTLNLVMLFNWKKRKEAVFQSEVISAPTVHTIEVSRESHRPAMGNLINIAHQIDAESVELYGRSPWVR